MHEKHPTPALSVVGVSKTHAKRAITYLRRRSILAFYRAEDKSLNTWELKSGREATYAALHAAIKETRSGPARPISLVK